ncbi:heterochromatin protein 1-like [Nilaparvata lugens]|uniref:heterochromatin protein 1-like n=1 Tax=Nilaparvata lugens TaxID=108931 RepID=UPI00193D2F01|nr:heterochromatin protein 1-like [Nilaparvata lugens]
MFAFLQENGSPATEDSKADGVEVKTETVESKTSEPKAKKAKKSTSINGKLKKRTASDPERKSSRVPPKREVFESEVSEPKKRKKSKPSKEYEVEKLIKSRVFKGKTEYLVRWKGYSPRSDSWEPAKNLSCDALIEKLSDEPAPKKKKTSIKPKKSPKKKKKEVVAKKAK